MKDEEANHPERLRAMKEKCVVCCVLCFVCCLLFVVCCLLSVVCCPLSVIRCPLSVVCVCVVCGVGV